ncbi:MAG: valine--tRNA ligase [Oscillospiraceae bacterium]|nr:valine--tRNA ligase [Oscillospiraceae bacterium]MDY3938359.1 valine--tRNA ligase [Oscillospiraceae bacterium]
MSKELEKQYNPKNVEDRIYKTWLDNKYFHAVRDESKKSYTIVIPPPNITGQLHMGHALDNTLQDILIRYKRMSGYDTLWVPGTDHASIATEAKIVEAMRKEGITKEDIGREKFLERAWDWKKQYGGRIVEQLKKLGSSCDWDRERFTLDEGCSKAVKEVFVRLYEKGLIYRGERIVNWCPKCLTSISDAEVEYEDQAGHFWHLRYPLADGSGYLELATTRPETMLGDTAVAVHPDDERYKSLVGKTLILPIVHREIPIIADEYVEPEFGTGCVKITPAHDPNDFEVGLRHNLEVIDTFTPDAHIKEGWGRYSGMDRFEARKAIVEDLEKEGALVRIEDYSHNVGTCYRCHSNIEPRVSKQWFVKMEPLAKPAIEAVRSGETKFVPERFDKTYYHWMENIKDWCISRQLWWGHRIPAWYCDDCGEINVAREKPCKCKKCGCENLTQDPDTLDTWFSSALWPFSTLGWPDDTPDLRHYFPTDTLVTGYDIIFFWVARMIFSSCEQMGKAPFNTVLIHGLVRDAQGRKMSKSLGNGIDPLEIIDKYGADALRFTLATGNSPGNDMRFSDEKVEASRNFANKLWNAARFVLMNLGEDEPAPHVPENLALEDKWILSKFNTLVRDVTDNLDKFELGLAVQKLYDFIWDILCDWYIELCKIRLNSDDEKAKSTAKAVLVYVMSNTLKLLHPFMPFITEEIWQTLPHDGDTIMLSPWCKYNEKLAFRSEEEQMESIMTAIKAVRNRRAEMNVAPSKKAEVFIETAKPEIFEAGTTFFKRLASASDVKIADSFDIDGTVSIVTADATIKLPLAELVDFEAERARLNKELAAAEKDLAFTNNKLNNQGFMSKAPEKVINEIKEKAAKYNEKIALLKESIAKLG